MPSERLAAIDFHQRFPYLYWLSSWSKSAEYPLGFRYKILSTRTGPTGPVEIVIAVEETGGAQTELERTEVSPSQFDKTIAIYVDGISESGDVHFFAMDLSRCRSAADYDRMVGDAGWNDTQPDSRGAPKI
jgi:hypothetical protein